MKRKILFYIFILFTIFSPLTFSQEPRGTDVLDVGLIVDESGSMRYNDPHNMRKDAALLLLDLLNQNDNIALVGFGEGARRINPFLEIYSQRSTLSQNIRTLRSADRYSMIKEGLQEMLNIIKERGVLHPTAIILLTDGEYQPDDLPPGTELFNYFSQLNKLAQEFSSFHVPIYTVAFTQLANIDVLSNIARQSGGASYRAFQASDIQRVYAEILQNMRPFYIRKISAKYLKAREKIFYVKVTPGVEQLIVTIFKESVNDPQPEVLLRDPSGYSVEGERSSTSSYYLVKVNTPTVGDWEVRVKGRGKVRINFIEKVGVNTAVLKPGHSELSKALNDELDISVQLTSRSGDVAVNDFEVEALITRPDGSKDEIRLRDDGREPDGVAGDGIFSGTYDRLDRPGRYSLTIRTFPRGNKKLTREIKEDITVKYVPDFRLEMESFLNLDSPIRLIVKPQLERRDIMVKKVEAEVTLKGKWRKTIALLDNGEKSVSGDEVAGDGVYSGLFRETKFPGIYNISVKTFFELKGGEIFSKEKRVRAYKLAEVKRSHFKVNRGEKKVLEFKIRYYGSKRAFLNLLRTDISPLSYFSITSFRDTFLLEPGKENLVKLSVTPAPLTSGGDYRGECIFRVRFPEIERGSKLLVSFKIHIFSWWDKAWPYFLGGLTVILIFLGFLITVPKFPRNSTLVVLSEKGEEIGRYNLRKYQKFGKNNVAVSKDLKITGIPRGSFKIIVRRDGRIMIKALKKKIRFSEEDVVGLRKSRVLSPMDEFYIDGVRLRYERG